MNLNSFQYSRYLAIRTFRSRLVQTFFYVVSIVGSLSVALLVVDFFTPLPLIVVNLSIVLCSPLILSIGLELYFSYLYTHPSYGVSNELLSKNPLNKLDYQAIELLYHLKNSGNYPDFWDRARNNNSIVAEILFRLGLYSEVTNGLYKGDDKDAISLGITNKIIALNSSRIDQFQVITMLLEEEKLANYLKSEKVNKVDVELIVSYYKNRQDAFLNIGTKEKTGGFAKTWAVSYTNLLDEVTTSLPMSISIATKLSPIYSRDSYVKDIVTELLKGSSTNVLLTGEAGVGKSEIFYHFATQVLHYQTNSNLDGSDVRELDIERLLALASNSSDLQQIIARLFGELSRAGNVILFIKHIDLLLSPNNKMGSTDIGNLLGGYLQTPSVKIVGTLTDEAYLEAIRPNAILSSNFTQIKISPPLVEEIPAILLSQVGIFENRYQCFFPLITLKDIAARANRYIKDAQSPFREIRLAEEVASETHARNSRIVTEEIVDFVVTRIAKVPIAVAENEKEMLLNLSSHLHQRIVGQDNAIKEVGDALLRARAGITDGARPIGSFLFLGPTGVGKTETAKALAEIYFGNKDHMVRLDMSEFADDSALSKLLGVDGVNSPGALTIAIQESPSTVVLFDEIEKSSTMVRNALLQLLDEGKITTNYGRVLDFTNAIIIATSNAGSDFIRKQINAGLDTKAFEKQLIDTLISKKIFLTEFLNRFDGVVVYTPLNHDEVRQIVVLEVAKLAKQIEKEKGVALIVADSVINNLALRGYDPVFGARALRRVIENDLETKIAKMLILDSPQSGSELVVDSLD